MALLRRKRLATVPRGVAVAERRPAPPGLCVRLAGTVEGTAVLELEGECDLATVPILQRRFEELLARALIRRVVLDLSNLTFIDARSLQFILLAHQSFPEGVVIVNPSALTRQVLEITSLAAVFSVDPSTARQ